MQSPPVITFHCPSCGMKLQVPAQMAGVAGPCPQCSATITAPASVAHTETAIPASPSPQTPQQPVHPQQPAPQQSVAQQPAYQHPGSGQNIPPHEPQPEPVSLRQPAQSPIAPRQPAPEQAQPQQSPQTDRPPQEQRNQIPNPASRETPRQPNKRDNLPRHIEAPKMQRNWMRIIFPLTFLLVATITVLVVLQAVGIYQIYDFDKLKIGSTDSTELGSSQTPDDSTTGNHPTSPTNTPDPDPISPASSVTPPDDEPRGIDDDPKTTSVPGEFPELKLPPPSTGSIDSQLEPTTSEPAKPPAPPEEASTPTATGTTTSGTDEKSPPTAGSRAYQTLTQFLDASTLEERLPLMAKSQLTHEQLKQSCLAKALGAVKSKRLAEMVPRASDGMIQYLYFVSFEDKTEPQMRHRIVVQLVERPDVHPPRIHADAFIEHYEKKFSLYGKQPVKGAKTFHCIAELRTSDLAKNIPEELKKDTIRFVIKTHPHGSSMFDAFLNKNSPLMDRVGPGKDFPYIESRFCILSFRWNTDNPDKPYVELNDIVANGWEK